MCGVYRVVLHYFLLHVGLLSGNNLEYMISTVGLAEGETASDTKTPPLSDQTGVTFFTTTLDYQQQTRSSSDDRFLISANFETSDFVRSCGHS